MSSTMIKIKNLIMHIMHPVFETLTSTRGIRTEIGRRRFLKACTRQLASFSVRLQFYPIEREVPFKLDTKMKYSRAMINPPEPSSGTPDDFLDFRNPSRNFRALCTPNGFFKWAEIFCTYISNLLKKFLFYKHVINQTFL